MALPPVPSNVAQYINEAASGTGLPASVVAAQNYTESAYGSNEGPSSAGAEGPWQFLPSTFTGLGFPISGISSWPTSTQAYVKYMSQLLLEEHGNVRNALAAYNAGPGNLSAGYGYADSILALAGQSQGITTTSATTSTANTASALGGGPGGIIGDLENILGLGAAQSFANDLSSFFSRIMWILEPSSWLRIGSFVIAMILLIAALIVFTKADQKLPPPTIPIPVPV